MKSKTFWSIWAPFYKTAMRKDEKTYQFMYHRIPEVIYGKEVLEIATGPGLLARHVAPYAKKMTATDYSEGMIHEAQKGNQIGNLHFETADACHLPYKDHSFDAVIIANALHIMDDPDQALAEIKRVLRPAGILIAPNFVNHASGNRLWTRFLKLIGVQFKHTWTEKTYQEYLTSMGWKITYARTLPARITIDYVECRR